MTHRTHARSGLPAAFVAALVCLTLIAPSGVGAEAPQAQAWWYLARNSQIPIATPVPPSVDDNGLYVAAGPNGAIAVAAVRGLVGDASSVTVTLELTETSGDVVLGACRTAPWFPVQAGNWDERPEPDCDAGSVSAVVDEGATAVTFDVSGLVDGGTVDIIITPGLNEDGTPANFTASIAPPGDGTIAATSAPAPSPTPTTAPAGGTATPTPDVAPPPSSGASRPFQPAAGVSASPPPSTGIEIPPQAPEVAAPSPQPLPRPASSGTDGAASDPGRLLGIGLIAALGVAYVVLRGREGPMPSPILAFRSTGPAAAEGAPAAVVSGVGRFAKDRVGQAPPLN